MLSSSKEHRNRCETLTCTRENFSCLLTTLVISGCKFNTTLLALILTKPSSHFTDRELRHGKISMPVNQLKNKTTVCIGNLNVDLTKLSCCPEYWARFTFYQLLVVCFFFLSLLERVVYFLQLTKYQRTGFKKQDYCSGI